MTSGTPRERRALEALTRTFIARFFENDVTGNANDLKSTFFWLIGFLAGPLTLFPAALMTDYHGIVAKFGPEALRLISRPHKLTAIMLGMAAAGLLATMTWNTLMLDRRDGLVLGTLPVRGRTIVLAKLLALTIYVGTVAGAMHLASSVIFGVVLAEGSGVLFLLRSPIAHLTATVGSCAFVFLAVTTVQGAGLAVCGPRIFRRVSPVLQTLLVAGVVVGFTQMGRLLAAVSTGQNAPSAPPAWLAFMPPAWFLGLDEWMLGGAEPWLQQLGRMAAGAMFLTIAVTLATYATSYRRVMVRVIESPDTGGPASWRTSLLDQAVATVTPRGAARAAAQFFFASISRVERLRLILAITAGVALASVLPTAALVAGGSHLLSPPGVLGLSEAVLMLVLVGLRITIAMPADPRASWIMAVVDAPRQALRSGVWRAVFLAGVVPMAAGWAVLNLWLFGPKTAWTHALVQTSIGALLVEVLLFRFEDMPSTRPWRPENANLRMWWPAYLFTFVALTGPLSMLEWRLHESASSIVVLAGVLLTTAAAVRVAHRRPHPMSMDDFETTPDPIQMLHLN